MESLCRITEQGHVGGLTTLVGDIRECGRKKRLILSREHSGDILVPIRRGYKGSAILENSRMSSCCDPERKAPATWKWVVKFQCCNDSFM